MGNQPVVCPLIQRSVTHTDTPYILSAYPTGRKGRYIMVGPGSQGCSYMHPTIVALAPTVDGWYWQAGKTQHGYPHTCQA